MIYAVTSKRSSGHLKIGYAKTRKTLKGRIHNHQAGNPGKLELVYLFDGERTTEAAIHRWCSPWRIEREWFDGGKEGSLVDVFLRVCAAHGAETALRHTHDDLRSYFPLGGAAINWRALWRLNGGREPLYL